MPASETTNPDAKSARLSSQSCGSKARNQPRRGGLAKELAPVAPDPPLPHLVRAALKHGWATPDAAKPKVVADLLAAFYDPDADPMLRVRLARLLLLLDQTQFER